MTDKAIYYDKDGHECPPEQADHMRIYIYDDDGNFVESVTSKCKH